MLAHRLARGWANEWISGNKAGGGKRWQTTVQRQLGGFLNAATSQHLEYDHVAAFTDTENFPEREYFTFSEKLEWARRLERIERVKSEERKKATLKQYKDTDMHKCVDREVSGITDEIVAKKSGFGSSNTYRKAKFIAENADEETGELCGTGILNI